MRLGVHATLYVTALGVTALGTPACSSSANDDGGATADIVDAVSPDEDAAGADTAQAGPDIPQPPATACEQLAPACRSRQQGCVGQGEAAECIQCAAGEAPAGPAAACAPIGGELMAHDFGNVVLAPGQEKNGWCQSWVLNNPTELWVNAVEFMTDGGYHHSNWFFVPEVPGQYPEGLWKGCYGQGFEELQAALDGGVLFAQSTQVERELQKFPDGVAVRIPPWSRVIAATHLLNPNIVPLDTNLTLRMWTIEPEEVQVKLTPFRLSYLDLNVPAGRKARFSGSCAMSEIYENAAATPFDMQLYYALPHYHALGAGFHLGIVGGPRDGEVLLENGYFGSEGFGRLFDPPVDLSLAEGLSFSCSYHNTLDKTVKWGIGIHEMCVMLGFAASDLAFEVTVLTTKDSTDDGDLIESTGDCVVLGLPFDQNKPGGPEPQGAP